MGMKFDMIGIFANDLGKMVAFYRDVIGMETDWNGDGPYAEFKHDGIRFSMYERSKLPELLGQKPDFPKHLNGTFELSINVGNIENVDEFFDKVTREGATVIYRPRNEPWKIRSAMVADPDGNIIEIASDFQE